MQSQTPGDMLSRLLEFLAERLDREQLEKVKQAAAQAQTSHEGRKRDGGEPYVVHPLRVALDLVVKLGIWENEVICASFDISDFLHCSLTFNCPYTRCSFNS